MTDLARPLILNVDDYEAARYMRTQALTRAGFVVREATTGEEALAFAAEHPPSIVLLDVNLPDMSGFEVCRRLKRQPATANVPVLHLSATFTKDSYKVRGLDGGADGYLVEPVDPPVLIATIHALLRARRAEADRDVLLARERAARAEAEAANRAKDEFLAVVSHELRTPLNAVLGWTRVLRTSPQSPEATERALEIIERSVRQQTQIINDLLDVSRIVSGTLSLDLHPVRLRDVVHAAVESIRLPAAAKELAIELELDGVEGVVMGDPSRLEQVIGNLLSNAVKFTPAHGRIRVTLTADHGVVRVAVTDTGAGISAAFLPYVFDRFRQADTNPARSQGGLGLGLAIVRHLAELHGGTVTAESPGLGHGATFTVHLPVYAADAPGLAHTRPDLEKPLLDGVRLLVVEDEPDSRDALTVGLELYGASVQAVASVTTALECLGNGSTPDAIISDIAMPGEDGYALIRHVHALTHESGVRIPTIALTAYARPDEVDMVLAAGFDLHVPKPADVEELARAVAGLIAGRRSAGTLPTRA